MPRIKPHWRQDTVRLHDLEQEYNLLLARNRVLSEQLRQLRDLGSRVYVLVSVHTRTVGHGTSAEEAALASASAYSARDLRPCFRSRSAAQKYLDDYKLNSYYTIRTLEVWPQ